MHKAIDHRTHGDLDKRSSLICREGESGDIDILDGCGGSVDVFSAGETTVVGERDVETGVGIAHLADVAGNERHF